VIRAWPEVSSTVVPAAANWRTGGVAKAVVACA
jgi:hypothetical protein